MSKQDIRLKGTIVHWGNSENQDLDKQKNDLSWLPQRSISLPGYTDTNHDDNSWFYNRPHHDFSASLHRHRRSSVLVGKRSMQLFEESGQKEPKFVKFIIKLYNKWGFCIARFAWPAMIICVLVSLLSLLKIITTPQRNDLEGYSPFEARSRIEYDRYLNFFSGRGLAISTHLYITAADGNSLLRPSHLNDTMQVLHLANNNITLYNPTTRLNQSYSQFCKEFCNINEPNAYMVQKWNIERGDRANPYLRLNYPISTLFGRSISIQPYFFGVELYNGNETREEIDEEMEGVRQLFGNDTGIELLITRNKTHPPVTNMKSVKMIVLHLNALENSQWSNDDMKRWEMDVVHFFENYESKHLKIYIISTTFVEEEMVRAGISILPYLIAGFIIMCTCSVITVMVRAAYMHQNNIFKVIENVHYAILNDLAFQIFLAIMACATPLLACSTALAILFLFGMRFSSILCVIPFLVLSIGIDSSYLMIHEWQRVTKEIRDGEKKEKLLDIACLSEVGPAILISALTNILADAVGCFTSSPEIRLLCIGNLFAMFMAYIYQMSFYSGLMSVVGKYEIAAEKNEDNTTNIAIRKGHVNIRKHSEVMGITRMNISLTPEKLFPTDSPLIENLRLLLMNNMVQDFENINGSWGSVGTMYFMRDFMLYQNYLESEHDYDLDDVEESTTTMDPDVFKFNSDNLADFLTWPEYDFWSGFIQLQNVSEDGKKQGLKRFFFTTAYHDEKLKKWSKRGELLKQWRAIVDKPA
ncbi:Patched family protein [Dirofilaria immitis]|nr:Patched family protein [Dirofilaria immitis]